MQYRERDTVICCRTKGLFCISVAVAFFCALSANPTNLASGGWQFGQPFNALRLFSGTNWNASATSPNDPQPKQEECVRAAGICYGKALREARSVT
jgi:hypothetical protein